MNTMTYKGYTAAMAFDAEDKIIVGRVEDIDDIITFDAVSVGEFEATFRSAIDAYIKACERLGQTAEKPASGRLMLRVNPAVHAAAVKTHYGLQDLKAKTARRVVTTGCGQGTVFGDLMSQIDGVQLPDACVARIRQSTLARILETMRQQDSIHRKAGSVHGCALFRGSEMLMFVEDVGRHNAIDTITGWMALHGIQGADKTFYTTGRLTSEMVMKAAQIGVPIIVSRNGVTAMGHEMASKLGMTLFGRAANRHFLCYTGVERFDSEPEPQRATVRVVAG